MSREQRIKTLIEVNQEDYAGERCPVCRSTRTKKPRPDSVFKKCHRCGHLWRVDR